MEHIRACRKCYGSIEEATLDIPGKMEVSGLVDKAVGNRGL